MPVTTLLCSGNILQVNQSVNGVTRSTFTARFSNMPNQTLTWKSPLRWRKWHVSNSCIAFLIALHNFGTELFIIFVDHPLQKKVFLTSLRPVPMSRRHMRGCNLVGVDTDLSLYLVCSFCEECHRGGCKLEGALLCQHYCQRWSNTLHGCCILL